jgi:hypothetical protein
MTGLAGQDPVAIKRDKGDVTMTRRRSILGALIAGALALCALGAANASAANLRLHECKETITEGTGVRFTANCAKKDQVNGTWETVKLPPGLVKVRTTGTSKFSLKATVAGVEFKIECESVEGEGEAENTAEAMSGSSTGESFTGCAVVKPEGKGCTVPSTIKTKALSVSTKEMNVNYKPQEGETFVVITVSGCSVGALNGEKPVTGTASAVVTEEEPTSAEFTATSGSALKFGGQTATFIGKAHSRTNVVNGNTLALETP